jgi:hypothetical protein
MHPAHLPARWQSVLIRSAVAGISSGSPPSALVLGDLQGVLTVLLKIPA